MRDTLQVIGLNLSGFPPDQKLIPTVYRANLRDPSSYFFAQQFPMRNKDVLYAAKANSVEVVKFINYAMAITSGASTVTADAAITRHAMTYLGKRQRQWVLTTAPLKSISACMAPPQTRRRLLSAARCGRRNKISRPVMPGGLRPAVWRRPRPASDCVSALASHSG